MQTDPEMTEWLRTNDLLDAKGDTTSLLDLAQHGDEADRDFALDRIAASAERQSAITVWLKNRSQPGNLTGSP